MSPTRYAAETEVPVVQSKRAIEQLLQQRGVEGYHTGWDATRDIVEFIWKGKQIRFVLKRASFIGQPVDKSAHRIPVCVQAICRVS